MYVDQTIRPADADYRKQRSVPEYPEITIETGQTIFQSYILFMMFCWQQLEIK